MRKLLCERRIEVTVNAPADTSSGQSYYSGNGYLRMIDRINKKVCVYFSGKGSVWFNRQQVTPIKGGL